MSSGRSIAAGVWGLLLIASSAAVGTAVSPTPPPAPPPPAVDFDREVRPLLAVRCLGCHGGARRDGGLRLDTREAALLGGDSGAALVPGESDRGELIRRVTTADPKHRMPLGGPPLSEAQVSLLRQWIDGGAPFGKSKVKSQKAKEGTGSTPRSALRAPSSLKHWAFRPVRMSAVPRVKRPELVRNPIDAFLLAKLEAQGLSFSPLADDRTLIRRLSLDLTGLPPAPEEVEAFVAEREAERRGTRGPPGPNPKPVTSRSGGGRGAAIGSDTLVWDAGAPLPHGRGSVPGARSSTAYDRLIDFLLASPHFGERWGRHWLDLARYAESDGYENDRLRPDAWRYRDWVAEALNADMPFDRFTVEQLAGDLLWEEMGKLGNEEKVRTAITQFPYFPVSFPEVVVATGFHRNTLWNSAASADKEEFRTLAVKDRADTTATAWMGLTLGCAKCHRHKYDPVTQREYYQFYAFFDRTEDAEVAVPGGKAPALRAVARTSQVHLRGNFLQKGDEVQPGTPAFLPPLKPRGATADRLDLARWLVDPAHPLTARVVADRTWRHLFGQGLVPTPENFGRSGSPPSHPELLDYLAVEFMAGAAEWDGDGEREKGRKGDPAGAASSSSGPSGLSLSPSPPFSLSTGEARPWSLKSLIRLIVTSTAYRQSSASPAANPKPRIENTKSIDPENRRFWRQNRFRVEAEIVRDMALAASGLLDRRVGGPSIVPPFPPGLLEQKVTSEALKLPEGKAYRRGIYVHVQRTLTHPTLAAFDGTDGNQPCVRRERSTTPVQALTLLNDPVYVECARVLGARLRAATAGPEERLRFGFRLCLGRPPEPEELFALTKLVRAQEAAGGSEEAVWNGVARTLLNLDEFITRE